MTDHFHPSDDYSQSVAHSNTAHALTENFEHVLRQHDPIFRAGGLEVVASVAIARVALLERQLASQEGQVRSRLYGRRERVENVVPFRKKDAPTRRPPLGA